MLRTTASLLLCIAALACSGGSSPRWSSNVAATHTYLLGTWTGTARSERPGTGGVVVNVSVEVQPPSAADRGSFPTTLTVLDGACASTYTGRMLATGDTVQIDGPYLTFRGTSALPTEHSTMPTMSGQYRVLLGPCTGDFGAVSLRRTPTSASLHGITVIEDFDWPDLFLRVITTR